MAAAPLAARRKQELRMIVGGRPLGNKPLPRARVPAPSPATRRTVGPPGSLVCCHPQFLPPPSCQDVTSLAGLTSGVKTRVPLASLQDSHPLGTSEGFPGGLAVKNLPAMQETQGTAVSISRSGRPPGEGNSYPHQYSCPEKSHGQRSPVGCHSWGHKESDTTE